MAKVDEGTNSPATVWMHQEPLLGYWFSVADECKEEDDIPYVPELEVARVRRELIDTLLKDARILLCTPYVEGECAGCDARMDVIRLIEAARDESEK